MGSRTIEDYVENRSGKRVRTSQLRRFVAEVRRAVKLKGGLALLICDDREIRKMNRWFRGKNHPTDVLSFHSDIPGHAGDLAISAETAAKNALRYRLTLHEEIKVLVLHGMLHLAGFDHEADNGEMEAREASLRKRLGLPVSLMERVKERGRAR